jgi:cytidylate kinase
MKEMIDREQSEAKRYKKYYDIDLEDKSIYDLVINSSDKEPKEIVDIIIRELRNRNCHLLFVSSKDRKPKF